MSIKDTESYAFDNFTSIYNTRNTSEIVGIVFQPIPGYSLEEYRRENIDLWKEVRERIENYFQNKKT